MITAEIWQGILHEFSDLPSVTSITRLTVRLFLGALLGGLIGAQRQWRGKPAGLRTHMLVCLGTAFFIAVPEQSGMDYEALSRIIQGLSAGIGFLGAGAILKHEEENRVQGLTTAASIWLTAAIGIAVGLGRDTSAVMGSLFAFVILTFLPKSQSDSDRGGPP